MANIARIIFGGTVWGLNSDSRQFLNDAVAMLQHPAKVVTFDNIEQTLGNDNLSRLLTEPEWSVKKFYAQTDITLPNDKVWTLTGNNVRISNDQRKRSLWIEIEYEGPNPELRTDLRDDAILHTVEREWATILSALLKMITDWIEAGSPPAKDDAFRTDCYGDWLRVVNGILSHSGAKGLVNRSERLDGLVENDAWIAFFEAVADQYGNATWTSSTLTKNYQLQGPIEALLPEGKKMPYLGILMRTKQNMWMGGYRLVPAGEKQHAKLWQLEKYGEEIPLPEEAKTDTELGLPTLSLGNMKSFLDETDN